MRGLPDIGEEGDKVRIPNNYVEAGADPFGNIAPVKGLKNKPKPATAKVPASLKHRFNAKNRTKAEAEALRKEVQKKLRELVIASLKKRNKGKVTKKAIAKEMEIIEEEVPMLEFQNKQHNISNEFTPIFKARVARIFRSQKRMILDQLKAVKAVDPKNY